MRAAADARARQPDDQVGPGRERRAAHHVTDCWYSVKPIAEQIAATIQKRRMIFVSDHAISSKWWWIGRHQEDALAEALEGEHLDRDRQRLDHEDAADQISSTSVWVITASPAIAPPSPSEPVSPMNTAAGNELNQRKPTHAPTRQAHSSASRLLAR